MAKKIEALRQDKQKVAELEDTKKRATELSQELERMRKELDVTKDATAIKLNSRSSITRPHNILARKIGLI